MRGRFTHILLSKLRLDGDTQARVAIDEMTVAEYADRMQAKDRFPPVIVYCDGKDKWLSSGFHRVKAALKIGRQTLPGELRKGSREDAAWNSIGDNHTHGLRMTQADKEKAITMALELKPESSDRAIANMIGCDHKTVAVHRKNAPTRPIPTGQFDHPGGSESSKSPANTMNPDDDLPPPLADDEPPTVAVDAVGNPLRSSAVKADFARAGEFARLAAQITCWKSFVRQKVRSGDRLFSRISATGWEPVIDNLRHFIDSAKPYGLCPHCRGSGCGLCHRLGWLTKGEWQATPEELRRALTEGIQDENEIKM